MKLVVVALLLALGCSKKKTDHFGDWSAADLQAKLQGAWVGPSPKNLVDKAAYEFTGDRVKAIVDGKELAYTLVIDSPCQLGLRELGELPSTTFIGMVVRDGKLVWGGGDTGARHDGHAVMCAGLAQWSVEDGMCFEREMSGRWADGKCGFKRDDGKDVFFWTWASKEDKKPMDGDYLMPDPDETATKVADLAAAKAKLAK